MASLAQDIGTSIPSDASFEAFARSKFSIVLTNPRLDDNPIVYANRAFEMATGYSEVSVIGRNCRFLQGDDTSPEIVDTLRRAIEEEEEVTVELLNYTADARPFRNRLVISPLRDEAGRVLYFLGLQIVLPGEAESWKGSDGALEEIQHRVKNHLSMLVGMIRIQAAQSSARGEFDTLSRRVESLQLLYEEMGDRRNEGDIAAGTYVSRIVSAIAHLDGRRGIRVNVDADAATVPFDTATSLGLLVSEILTNALQHAFEGRDVGGVEVRVKQLSGGALRVQIADDGIGMPDDLNWPEGGNLGSRIVRQLVQTLEASLSVTGSESGTVVCVDIPRPETT